MLVGLLEEAAQDEMNYIDGLISTFSQSFCQLLHVLLNVLHEKAYWILHWWLYDTSQRLKEQQKQGKDKSKQCTILV